MSDYSRNNTELAVQSFRYAGTKSEKCSMLRLPAHLSARIGVAPRGWIFIKFDAGDFYKSLPRN